MGRPDAPKPPRIDPGGRERWLFGAPVSEVEVLTAGVTELALGAATTTLRPTSADGAERPQDSAPAEQPVDGDGELLDDLRRIIGRSPSRSGSVLHLGCDVGDVAAGLISEIGVTGHYTGVGLDRSVLDLLRRWSATAWSGRAIELLLATTGSEADRVEPGGPIGFELTLDRRYDLIVVGGPFADPAADLGEYLRFCRHHLTPDGSVVVIADEVDRHVLGAVAVSSGLVLQESSAGGRLAVLGDGLSAGRGQSERTAALHAWDRRRIAELEWEAARRDREIEQLERRVEELSRALHDRERRLHDAQRTLSRRSVRTTIDLTNRARRVQARGVRPQRGNGERMPAASAVTSPPVRSSPWNGGVERRRTWVTADLADLVVYTAVVTEATRLPDVAALTETGGGRRVRFVCFGATLADAPGWEVRPIQYVSDDPLRTVAFHAANPHLLLPDVVVSVWIDPDWIDLVIVPDAPVARRIDLLASAVTDIPTSAASAARQLSVAAFVTPDQDCLYAEADALFLRRSDHPSILGPYIDLMAESGHPEHGGLHETGVIVRRHLDPAVVDLDRTWWAMMERGSRCDRLGFEPAIRLAGIDVAALDPAHPDLDLDLREIRDAEALDRRRRLPTMRDQERWQQMPWSLRTPGRAARASEPPTLGPVDVVVPVHDALPYVQRCVASVLSDPCRDGRLVLVDDGSRPATAEWLAACAEGRPDVVLVRNERAIGFSGACNVGIAHTDAPVVTVLNSDAVVPTGWTIRMGRRLTSHPGIGLIGPLSNAASWQSVPHVRTPEGGLAVNGLPPGMDLEDLNRFLEELCADVATPLVGVLNGFCMMIRREVLTEVGGFDQHTFPHGYGEEVDLVLRATDAGFLCAVAPDTYVYHAKSQSFGAARREQLKALGREQVISRYGRERVNRVARSTRHHPTLQFVRAAVAELSPQVETAVLPSSGP